MSEEVLNNLSLEYLVSNHQKKKLENSTFFINRKNILAKDKKFYKKRIVNLIKNVLTTEDMQLPNDLKKNIDAMFHKIITHFKEIDKAELIQTEYNTPSINDFNDEDFKNEDFNNNQTISDEITTELNKEIMMDLSKICMRKRDGNPLEKFITITKCQQEDPVYPQKKKLKLKTQEFKRKGINKNEINKNEINKNEINKNAINKKKNININYDEEKSETPTFEE